MSGWHVLDVIVFVWAGVLALGQFFRWFLT